MLNRRQPFLFIVAIALVAFAIYYPFSPGGVQAHNMAKARAHIPRVQCVLESAPQFDAVELHEFTAEQGSLLVSGTVPTRTDLDRLKEIVASTSPPTAVVFWVSVEDEISRPETGPSR